MALIGENDVKISWQREKCETNADFVSLVSVLTYKTYFKKNMPQSLKINEGSKNCLINFLQYIFNSNTCQIPHP